MATTKKQDAEVRRLTRIAGGTSYAVIIPMDYIRKLGWRAKQKLEVRLVGDRISISDWK